MLQRNKPVPVWGRATPGEAVSVSFLGQTVQTRAAADGRWSVFLFPMPATTMGADLVVKGSNTITRQDVVVGEVWLCSGQSNMELELNGKNLRALNAAAEVAAANYPLIRQFKLKNTESDSPLETATGTWKPCSPATASLFSAVGYFFARDIYRKLGVPIGLVNSSWGGTPIEAWSDRFDLASDPAFAVIGQRWQQTLADFPQKHAAFVAALDLWTKEKKAAEKGGPGPLAKFLKSSPQPYPPNGPGAPATPSGLFNGMIYPLLPYALRGVLWYQGEANINHADEYHRLFAAMITAWRSRFEQGDIPFFWVQLANFEQPGDPTHERWAFLREAQSQTLSLPNTGQAVIIDIGDPANIHPQNKQEVGRRLALIAKAKVYDTPVDFSGPVFAAATREGSALRVSFTDAGTGLIAAGHPLQSFEIAGADRQFHPADAAITGETVLVQSPQVPAPVAVRYAWRNAPDANLYNGAGLPAVPFRSDGW